MTTHLTDKEIGEIIKKKRLELNLTQAQLGEKLGVAAAAVNKWEQGIVTNIKREILRNISLVLKIHPAYLIGLEFNTKEFVISSADFSDEEMNEIQNYIQFVVFKRNKNLEGLQHSFMIGGEDH